MPERQGLALEDDTGLIGLARQQVPDVGWRQIEAQRQAVVGTAALEQLQVAAVCMSATAPDWPSTRW